MLPSAWMFCISTASYNSLNKANDLPLVLDNPVLLFHNFNYKSEDNFYVSTPLPSEYYFRTQNLFNEWANPIILPNNSPELFLECNH